MYTISEVAKAEGIPWGTADVTGGLVGGHGEGGGLSEDDIERGYKYEGLCTGTRCSTHS